MKENSGFDFHHVRYVIFFSSFYLCFSLAFFYSMWFVCDSAKARNKSRLCVCVLSAQLWWISQMGIIHCVGVIIWWAKQKTFCTWLVVILRVAVAVAVGFVRGGFLVANFIFCILVQWKPKIYRLSDSIKLCQENNRAHSFCSWETTRTSRFSSR